MQSKRPPREKKETGHLGLAVGVILVAVASSRAWAGDHRKAQLFVPVVPGYVVPANYTAAAPVGQPVLFYPTAMAPVAAMAPAAPYGYAMPSSGVGNAPTGGYYYPTMTQAVTTGNAPQQTVVPVGSAPAGSTGGTTYTWQSTAVGSAPPAAPAESRLKDEGKRKDVFEDLKDAYPAVREENPNSRVNQRARLTEIAKPIFVKAAGGDATVENLTPGDSTDIDQMVSAVMKSAPATAGDAPRAATGSQPAYYYYMAPYQPVQYVPVQGHHHHLFK